MALITLEKLRFYAYHGVHEAEQVLGGEFELDIQVKAGIDKAAAKDAVEETINYETIYQLCKLEMANRYKLLETVVVKIADRMKSQFPAPAMEALRVRIRKINPPLGGRVEASAVEEVLDFSSECPRCKKKFISYEKLDCFKRFPNLHPATRETLARQFGPRCLCDDCLKFYAG